MLYNCSFSYIIRRFEFSNVYLSFLRDHKLFDSTLHFNTACISLIIHRSYSTRSQARSALLLIMGGCWTDEFKSCLVFMMITQLAGVVKYLTIWIVNLTLDNNENKLLKNIDNFKGSVHMILNHLRMFLISLIPHLPKRVYESCNGRWYILIPSSDSTWFLETVMQFGIVVDPRQLAL